MDEAWRLYRELPYAQITVAGIARGIGLAKGTVYLYFSGKESLFLSVLTAQLSDWFAELSETLGRGMGEASAFANPAVHPAALVARSVARSLAARHALARLLAESHVILEQNADAETISAYKSMLLAELSKLAEPFGRALGISDTGFVAMLLLEVYALLVGTQQLADPAPLVREVIEESDQLAIFAIDFELFFGNALHALLLGALAQQTGKISEGETNE